MERTVEKIERGYQAGDEQVRSEFELADEKLRSDLKEAREELGQVDRDQWDAINALRNRLPTWATFAFAGLAAIASAAVTVAITALF